jgi:hypothetical protein
MKISKKYFVVQLVRIRRVALISPAAFTITPDRERETAIQM